MAETIIQHYWAPIAEYFEDDSISDIYVTRYNCVTIKRRGERHRVAAAWPNEAAFANALLHLAQSNNIDMSAAGGTIDAMIGGSIRINAGLPPRAQHAHATLRIPRRSHFTLSDLETNGMIPASMRTCIRRIIDAELNPLITGATGSGKTTLMRALIGATPSDLVHFIIEDTPELNLQLELMIHHTTPAAEGDRDPSAESIYSALRSAPDRVHVGEIRRPQQLIAYLRVLACGFHGIATLHSTPGEGVINRGREMLMEQLSFADPSGYDQMLLNNIDVLLHCQNVPGFGPRLVQVDWVDPTRRGLRNLYRLVGRSMKSDASGLEAFMRHADSVS
jgi:pilus assembly protein CpaF